jgi:hypothetical protein
VITAGELGRVLNALSATLNDRRDERFEPERVQKVVTGALGGEPHLSPLADPAQIDGGWLLDEHEMRVARIERRDGRWEVERLKPPGA